MHCDNDLIIIFLFPVDMCAIYLKGRRTVSFLILATQEHSLLRLVGAKIHTNIPRC